MYFVAVEIFSKEKTLKNKDLRIQDYVMSFAAISFFFPFFSLLSVFNSSSFFPYFSCAFFSCFRDKIFSFVLTENEKFYY